jgi:hypothetical protein
MGAIISCFDYGENMQKQRGMVNGKLTDLSDTQASYEKKIQNCNKYIGKQKGKILEMKGKNMSKKEIIGEMKKLRIRISTRDKYVDMSCILFRADQTLRTMWDDKLTLATLKDYAQFVKKLKPEATLEQIQRVGDDLFDIGSIFQEIDSAMNALNDEMTHLNTETQEIVDEEYETMLQDFASDNEVRLQQKQPEYDLPETPLDDIEMNSLDLSHKPEKNHGKKKMILSET